jgi:hypothetical protein
MNNIKDIIITVLVMVIMTTGTYFVSKTKYVQNNHKVVIDRTCGGIRG